MSKSPAGQSVFLITSATEGVRDCGTGFCVGAVGDDALVVTCAHVVDELTTGGGAVRVNGLEATAISSAEDRGIDLSLLKVPHLGSAPLSIASRIPLVKSPYSGFAYKHLHGRQYVSAPLRGTVAGLVTMREQLSTSGVQTLRLTPAKGERGFAPGNSGSPILNAAGEVIGVLAFASGDGKLGYALSATALREIFPLAAPVAAPLAEGAQGPRPLPPDLPSVTVTDDLQRGRFGGKSSDGVVELRGTLGDVSGTSYFSFDISVAPLKKDVKLLPPARFFLHDTFPRSVIQITRPDPQGGFTLYEVRSYGVFTIGCHVYASDGRWHSVEYNLAKLKDSEQKDLPAVFKNR